MLFRSPGFPVWSPADFARFARAVKVTISTQPGSTIGDVADVERGDMTPDDAVAWVVTRRAAGAHPTVYLSEAAWPDARRVFHGRGIPEPEWWIAGYPGSVGAGVLYSGAVAHQYEDRGPYDVSVVADYWPGVDSIPGPPIPTRHSEDRAVWIAYVLDRKWCDVYYSGVLVDAFENSDNPNQYGIGERFSRYIAQGIPYTTYTTEGQYAPSRRRLSVANGGPATP